MGAEDYTGNRSLLDAQRRPGPEYLDDYTTALADAGIAYDVYDVDAQRPHRAATHLGVLSHYKAVIWETGDDLYVREPGAARRHRQREAARRGDDRRPRLHERRRQAARRPARRRCRGRGTSSSTTRWGRRRPTPFCKSNQTRATGNADDPPGQNVNCIIVSNDFIQYWLGAYRRRRRRPGDTADAAQGLPPFGSTRSRSTAATRRDNQADLYTFVTTSSVLPAASSRSSRRAGDRCDGPPAYDPPEGTKYAYSQQSRRGLSAAAAHDRPDGQRPAAR